MVTASAYIAPPTSDCVVALKSVYTAVSPEMVTRVSASARSAAAAALPPPLSGMAAPLTSGSAVSSQSVKLRPPRDAVKQTPWKLKPAALHAGASAARHLLHSLPATLAVYCSGAN
jgi:hypothetical protein